MMKDREDDDRERVGQILKVNSSEFSVRGEERDVKTDFSHR